MSFELEEYDIRRENDILKALDFNWTKLLKHVDRVFKATITNIVPLTELEKLFQIRIDNPQERERFSFLPGQFLMLELPGYGEVPISISSSPSNHHGYVELCIRKAGVVTTVLHRAKIGSRVGVRGPFGSAFPLEKMKGSNVLLVAGGLGLAPLRAPIYYVSESRPDFKNVHVFYGAKAPDQLLFDYQYEQWRKCSDLDLKVIVESPDDKWTGEVGMITKLVNEVDIDPKTTFAIVCGPPVMFKFVCNALSARGIPMRKMFVSLERRMHCGMGKCCRCNVGATYTCLDGPVFDYWTVMNLKEAI